ncbi:MAG: tRNA nucleotidyltransferase/poly(A) polymerase [Rubritalea sp.]|jgi:tRNA nucleotidyltransferase/poly(A) polymerase
MKVGKEHNAVRIAAIGIARKLSDAGHVAYFAGGCVRDALLEKVAKDFDIATSATPEQVQGIFPNADAIGSHFGVMLVKVNIKGREKRESFEVATFRTDGSYHDGRRPESVEFSSPEEDAQRRDFTVNGLFQDTVTGEVIDFVNGQADLKAGVLRAIGRPEERFQEDALRLMRAVRFATTLGFEIEPTTWIAICENADLLGKISIERIQAEFSRIIVSPHRRRGLELLVDSGLIKYFLPEVLDLIGCEQPPQWHPEGDVYTHTCIMLEMLGDKEVPITLALSVLLHDIGKPATYTYDEGDDRIRFNGHDGLGAEMSEVILRRMKYPNDTIEDVRVMVANHMNFMHVKQMRVSKLKRFMSRDTFDHEIELHRVDCASSNGFTENYDFVLEKREEFANEPLIPDPLIKGRDLMDLGLSPGPKFKEMLTAVQNEQLESRLSDRESAIAWVKENYGV